MRRVNPGQLWLRKDVYGREKMFMTIATNGKIDNIIWFLTSFSLYADGKFCGGHVGDFNIKNLPMFNDERLHHMKEDEILKMKFFKQIPAPSCWILKDMKRRLYIFYEYKIKYYFRKIYNA